MVSGTQLINPAEDDMISNYVVRNICAVMDGAIFSDVARNECTVGNTGWYGKVVISQKASLERRDAYEPCK